MQRESAQYESRHLLRDCAVMYGGLVLTPMEFCVSSIQISSKHGSASLS